MKSIILAVSVAATFNVSADSISTGRAGLTYHDVFGRNLAMALREQGHKLEVVESKGSGENLDRVASGESILGFTQADAFMTWREANPNSAMNVEILGSLNKECAFLAVSGKGKIKDEDDIKEGVKIAVGPVGSGSAYTWEYMTKLESDYAKASVFNKGGPRTLSNVATGGYDAFLWVTAENNMNNEYLTAVQSTGSGLKLVSLDDYSLNNKLPNGEAVYEFRKVPVESGWLSDTKIEAPCTDVLVVGNTEADEKVLDATARILLTNKQRVISKK